MRIGKQERENYLREILSEAGISPEDASINVLVPLRLQSLRGILADFILKVQHGGFPSDKIFAVLVPRLSDSVIGTIRDYTMDFHPQLRWLAIDEMGRTQGNISGDESELGGFSVSSAGLRGASASVQGFASMLRSRYELAQGRLFTPNNQWLLKVVLLSGLEQRFWGGPHLHEYAGIGELAEAADIPQPSVSRFVGIAEAQGFLYRSDRGLGMRRIPELLEQWAFDNSNTPSKVVYYRALFPESGKDDSTALQCDSRVVVSGQAAVSTMGLAVTNVDSQLLYSSEPATVLEDNDFLQCSESEAQGAIQIPVAERSIYAGSVGLNGRKLADILQLYLDVRFSMARGEEQARHLFETVLGPHFRRKRWL
ncbi:MAG: hypothetical protein RRC34_16585 [Lentisphaeria bacterium]|nr:hypothetical protein [Lentisphaeria bacterium]